MKGCDFEERADGHYINCRDYNGTYKLSSVGEEMYDYIKQLEATIIQIHKTYGCEIQDPNGTIWDYAKKIKAQNQRMHEALRLMLSAAQDADNQGELFDSFDGELLDMAKEALKDIADETI